MKLITALALAMVTTGCTSSLQTTRFNSERSEVERKQLELMVVTGLLYGQVSMQTVFVKGHPEQVAPLCHSLAEADRIRNAAREYGFEDRFVEENSGVIEARAICAGVKPTGEKLDPWPAVLWADYYNFALVQRARSKP